MLNYQEESCELTLKEGIEEYRSYLKENNRHVLGEHCSEDEKFNILCHDATHVIFGLDTSLEEEAMLDCWIFFGGDYFKVTMEYFKGSLDIKETILGSAEIQKIFKVSTAGKIAGSKVVNGEIRSKSSQNQVRNFHLLAFSE